MQQNRYLPKSREFQLNFKIVLNSCLVVQSFKIALITIVFIVDLLKLW